MKEIYEKMGLFYLGKDTQKDSLTLYKSKHLTTHALLIGMTGSGKTGLGIDILEEAALDNIPSIVIDPKGDMGNLCLAFENLDVEKFTPWVQKSQEAQQVAQKWKEGLASFHQDVARVNRFAKVEKTIYTPGSSSGISVNILGSFEAPSQDIIEDNELLISYINTTVSSLLALLNIEADPLNSQEHLLLSNIFYHFYQQNISLSLEDIIGYIASPPFEKIGVFSLKTFYPQKERMKLAMALNGMISSLSFSSWIVGEALDIQKMLYDENGKAKIAIFNIAHLDDAQRMFFVTLFLNSYISWMRKQRGSSSLKTVLYMDEIYGFFPPSKNPPSKEPMLLLLKQARAFGVGVVLATQNPVDIDYKGLSNIGTWFVGKLQTKQDIQKIVDALSQNASLAKEMIAKELTSLQSREFFLRNSHTNETKKFITRWALSYLKGPITQNDIKKLMAHKKDTFIDTEDKSKPKSREAKTQVFSQKPLISSEIQQFFVFSSLSDEIQLTPFLYADVSVRFYNKKRLIDEQKRYEFQLPLFEKQVDFSWEESYEEELKNYTLQSPRNVSYGALPSIISDAKNLKVAEKKLSNYLYTTQKIELFVIRALKMESALFQTKTDFLIDVEDKLREIKDEKREALEQQYEKKFATLQAKQKKLENKLQKEKEDVSVKTSDTLLDVGMALFGAFFGRRSSLSSSVRKGVGAIKKGSQIEKEKNDVVYVETLLEKVYSDMEALQSTLEEKLEAIENRYHKDNYMVESIFIKPRRADIVIDEMALVWKQ